MLTYHPAYDNYHCFLRILSILVSSKKEFEVDSVRIFDFYLCAPSGLKTFKFPREFCSSRKLFRYKINHYNSIPNQRALFVDLKGIQDAVFDRMLSMGIIDHENYYSGRLELIYSCIPEELLLVVGSENSIDSDVKSFVLENLTKVPLLGPNGLKHRSGLMDHRYDLV